MFEVVNRVICSQFYQQKKYGKIKVAVVLDGLWMA